MTDWYPQASRPPGHAIRWDDLQVLAKDRPSVPVDRIRGRYYAARETDSAIVRTANPDKREVEKFLFYRGVGDFTMPFVVRAEGNGKFTVKNTGTDAIPAYILVNVQEKKVAFKVCGHLSPGTEDRIEMPVETSTTPKLGEAMQGLLVQQGLYEKEAKAMVKTWSEDWFGDEGTRVLYLVGEPVTNELLPLKIDPKPDQLLRVLVGRHDVLTPEKERAVEVLVKRVNGESNIEAKAADAVLNKMGRYRWAAQKAAEGRLNTRGAARPGR